MTLWNTLKAMWAYALTIYRAYSCLELCVNTLRDFDDQIEKQNISQNRSSSSKVYQNYQAGLQKMMGNGIELAETLVK